MEAGINHQPTYLTNYGALSLSLSFVVGLVCSTGTTTCVTHREYEILIEGRVEIGEAVAARGTPALAALVGEKADPELERDAK